ncbi:MAG: beta-lactamase family protein [Algicola sp.]|nr:beta-lactamase family protein [Algicola sp.]
MLWAWILPLPNTVQQQANQALSHGFDGIIVYVDEAGKPPAFYSAGWNDRVNKIPADPQSLFKIGSIKKLYVAVAATKLVNNQMLSLDDTLAEHFPALVNRIENAEKINLRLMLQHRSGIPNYSDNADFPWGDPPQSKTEKLEFALDLPAIFAPNDDYDYSNTNYLLIAQIIEKVLGYSAQQYIKAQILHPLGLNNTFSSLSEVDINDVINGYYKGWAPDPDDLPSDYYPGYRPNLKAYQYGTMIATAQDVGLFLRALNDGSLFAEGEQAIYSSIYEYDHTGWVPGYLSCAKYHKDIDTVVVQFVNTSDDVAFFVVSEIICDRIGKILHEQQRNR